MDEEELVTDHQFLGLPHSQTSSVTTKTEASWLANRMLLDMDTVDMDSTMDRLVNRTTLCKQVIMPMVTVCNLQVQISISGATQVTAYLSAGSNREARQDPQQQVTVQGRGGLEGLHHCVHERWKNWGELS